MMSIHGSFDQISEEALGDIIVSSFHENDVLLNFDLPLFFDEVNPTDFPIAGTCELQNFTESLGIATAPGELDGYLGASNSQELSTEYDNSRALINNLPVYVLEKDKKLKPSTKPIELSGSVGVGVPQKTSNSSQLIQIVHELEESFRPRYKSDYFAQNGKSRKPRYVADRIGNHYVTLRVPHGLRGKIRIDWLTIPDKSGDRYSMPYRFQRSNELAEVEDSNPHHLNIEVDKNGIMKLYLVLIKSKQDELKTHQPLKPFHPFQDVLGMPGKTPTKQPHPLNPKQLIKKYQLDKSQLAFTFCAAGIDGTSCIPQWDTTVYSTILTELPPENAKQKAIACPKCTHRFVPPNAGTSFDQGGIEETMTNKRKDCQFVNERIIKKHNSFS